MSLNRVVVQGRLVADPELKTVGSDVSACSIRVAVDRDYKNKETGERASDFFTVNTWRSTAEFLKKYFAKGDSIVVEGKLRTRSWNADDGTKRSVVEIEAENVYFAGNKSEGGRIVEGNEKPAAATVINEDDELPF